MAGEPRSRPIIEDVARRSLAALTVVGLLAAACGGGFREASEALSASPSTPPPSPSEATTPGGKPAIVVRTPAAGDLISSPVAVAGTADVFEATVSIRILDEGGQELASGFATATCGSGCRGRYETELFFFVDRRQSGTVEVFESSAEDGSQLFLVSIPVTLVPGA